MFLYLYIDFYDRKTNPRQDDTGDSRRQTQTATVHEVRLSMTNNLTGSDQSAENTTRTGESDERTENTGDSTSNRRRFLLGVGAATALVAGCVSGGDDDGDTGSDGSDNGGDTGSDNGGDTGSDNGGDDGNNGDDSSDNGDDSSDNGADTGGDNGDDTGSDNGGDTGSDDSGDPYGGDDGDDGDPYGGSNGDDSGSNGDGDDGGSDDGGGDDDSGDSPSAEFFDTFQWSSEFRMVTTAEEAGGTAELVFNDGDRYLTFEGSEGQSSEMYFIDDTVYVVAEGECIVYDSAPFQVPEEPTDIQQEEDLQEQNPDITEVGTDTIDGDPVTVYEVDAEMLYTMYVLESGYPRRVEGNGQSVDYYDWGDTDPIEPPDMDCSSPGGGGDGGGNYP